MQFIGYLRTPVSLSVSSTALPQITSQTGCLHANPCLWVCSGETQIKTSLLVSKALACSWKSHLSWLPDVVCPGPPCAAHSSAIFILGQSSTSLVCPFPHHFALVIAQLHLYLSETPGWWLACSLSRGEVITKVPAALDSGESITVSMWLNWIKEKSPAPISTVTHHP